MIKRDDMQSLASQSVVSSKVIDGWSLVRNHNEMFRNSDSPRRYFFTSAISMDPMITNQHWNIKQRYEAFRKHIAEFCKNDNEVISMRNLDLVFFPVTDPTYFYMVVFNLRHPSIVVVDSDDRNGSVEDLYYYQTYALQDLMIMHLNNEGHMAGKAYRLMDQEQLKMRWQITENRVNCGVMLMRHMEMYMGGDVRKWDSGLYKESTKQKK